LNLLKTLRSFLQNEEYQSLVQMACAREVKVAHGLIGLLAESNETIKWRAVTTLGQVTEQLFSRDPERARTIIRQLIWNLNEESGGIGWGMPEALGEILAVLPALQKEYGCLLVSYIVDEHCFIENEQIQKGVLWGFGRVKDLGPDLRAKAVPFLLEILNQADPELQATAVWALGEMGIGEALPFLKDLPRQNRMVKIYSNGSLQEKPFFRWVEEAIQKLEYGGEARGRD
jgi:HEAT-like repeat